MEHHSIELITFQEALRSYSAQGGKKMAEKYPIETLKIIGYWDSLAGTIIPRSLCPIYSKDEKVLDLARLEDNGKFVKGSLVELKYIRTEPEDEPTIFSLLVPPIPSIPAQPNYILWIDEDFAIYYEPAETALENFAKLRDEYLQKAFDAGKKGHYGLASILYHRALCADEKSIDALAGKVACMKRMHTDPSHIELVQDSLIVIFNDKVREVLDSWQV